MTATSDEAPNNLQDEEVQVVSVPQNITQDQDDEDVTVQPNDQHPEQLVQPVLAQATPHNVNGFPTLHISPPSSPFAMSYSEHRPSSPQSSYTHTEVTAGSDRSSRRRSLMDPRNNRFSGFLTSFMRRDRDRDQDHQLHSKPGRPSSPLVPHRETLLRNLAAAPRPITPPPPLPAPSLQELGLSLSVLTANLSPSHFTTPPTHGTLLSPHYLLLCHSQGLDVLPLTRPPAPQPYALVRRVPFKSVVVMEERGVLVAIAGRRDGVRIYALDEIRKFVEWRMDNEIRREYERMRREGIKRGGSGPVDNIFGPVSASSNLKSKNGLPLPSSTSTRKATLPISTPAISQSLPKIPHVPHRKSPPRPPSPPPQYEDAAATPRPRPRSTASGISINQSPSRASVSTVVGMPRRGSVVPDSRSRRGEEKNDPLLDGWAGSSDDEAISLVAAGPSGSADLDERTSNIVTSRRASATIIPTTATSSVTSGAIPPIPSAISRSRRPSNLDLSGTSMTQTPNSMPSPAPTLMTLRQTLSRSPPLSARGPIITDADQTSEGEADGEVDGDDVTTPTGERISFAQALLESRLPNIPPLGSRQAQRPVFIAASHPVFTGDEDIVINSGDEDRPATSSGIGHRTSVAPPKTPSSKSDRSKRRRWTVLDGMFNSNTDSAMENVVDQEQQRATVSPTPSSSSRNLPRISSNSSISRSQSVRTASPSTAAVQGPHRRPSRENSVSSPVSESVLVTNHQPRASISSNRFLPRIISNALNPRRSDDIGSTAGGRVGDTDGTGRRLGGSSLYPQTPAPKMDYVKLPGTKGALMIKAVETQKKSFLAILCGENGEKVELYAGTYRTALGLSRTFILPDSPRNLELQLQGDDLVEVFLVFSHNVFGLEPATVRVREVRIGRAERRAARRRAREARGDLELVDNDNQAAGEEETNALVNVGTTRHATPPSPDVNGSETPTSSRPHPVRRITDTGDATSSPAEPAAPMTSVTNPEDLVALAASQIGSYTTFQQLSFAPNFPLATLADECIIPPTYPEATIHHPKIEINNDISGNDAPSHQTLPPPGLPLRPSMPPSKWYYKDPKGIVQGPWKASLMQSWYKDGFLPLDLPVRRDTESQYILLKDLRLQAVDPNFPFRPAPLPLAHTSFGDDTSESSESSGPEANTFTHLLNPISLLVQPRHYGPPALFFSSRGGHSTTIVDARGRSVLKGRFFWSIDEEDNHPIPTGKLGDIRRVEAFDVRDRAIIVALRQGGLEAVDVGDALLSPADESRSVLPDFQVPPGNVSRRGTYIWRIGAPVSMGPVSSSRDGNTNNTLSLVRKKHTSSISGLGKSPMKSEMPSLGFDDGDFNSYEEVLFLGRKDDSVYFCERNAASFRILRLAPTF